MTRAEHLNQILHQHAPAAARCLSEIGRRAVFPHGIPAQAQEARSAELRATMGQVTDGEGAPLPLGSIADGVRDLDPKMTFLYSPQSGHQALREAWSARQRARAGTFEAPVSLPMVTHGLTQGVSLVAHLFGDATTDVVLPDPHWENYDLLFTFHARCRLRTYPAFSNGRWNSQGLADSLAQCPGKAIVVLNFPQNPSGYSLLADEAEDVINAIVSHPGPLVVLVDDAYLGMTYEDELHPRSLFWDLVDRADPERHFIIKTDGATKELLFFPGRVGFVTYGAPEEAQVALESKLKCVCRATVGAPPGPSQALALRALQSAVLETELAERIALLEHRYHALKQALDAVDSPLMKPFPFNSGCFAMVGIDPRIPVEELRRSLIYTAGVGTIAVPTVNALRIAYCSTKAEALPELVSRIAHRLSTW